MSRQFSCLSLFVATTIVGLLWMSSVGFAEDEQLKRYKEIWAGQTKS